MDSEDEQEFVELRDFYIDDKKDVDEDFWILKIRIKREDDYLMNNANIYLNELNICHQYVDFEIYEYNDKLNYNDYDNSIHLLEIKNGIFAYDTFDANYYYYILYAKDADSLETSEYILKDPDFRMWYTYQISSRSKYKIYVIFGEYFEDIIKNKNIFNKIDQKEKKILFNIAEISILNDFYDHLQYPIKYIENDLNNIARKIDYEIEKYNHKINKNSNDKDNHVILLIKPKFKYLKTEKNKHIFQMYCEDYREYEIEKILSYSEDFKKWYQYKKYSTDYYFIFSDEFIDLINLDFCNKYETNIYKYGTNYYGFDDY